MQAREGHRPRAGLFPLALAAPLLLFAAGAQVAEANTVAVNGAGEGSGTVTSTGGETNFDCHITAGVPDEEEGEVCEAELGEAESLITTATADEGSEFGGWTYVGDEKSNCSGTKNPCSTIFFGSGEAGTLTATFESIPPNIVNVEGAGTGSGTVTSEGLSVITPLNCHITAGVPDEGEGEVCAGEFAQGEFLEPDFLVFTPDPGSAFVKCSYAGEGLAECGQGAPFNEENPSVIVFTSTGEEGTVTAEFEAPPPSITGLDPEFGSIEGGDAVRIEGQGLVAVSEVRFGSTLATGVVELSPTELEVTAPPGAPLGEGDYVDVTLTNPGGTSAPRKAARYTYLGPPRALTIARTGAGEGGFECSSEPSSDPGGPFVPCLAVYFGGQSVLVRAVPEVGSTFDGWSGCDEVLNLNSCLIHRIDAPTTITATFHPAAGPPSPIPPFALQPFALAPETTRSGRSAKLRRAVALRKSCLAKARRAHKRALRAAKRRKGKARVRALRAAAKRKARATRRCNRRFKRQRRALRG